MKNKEKVVGGIVLLIIITIFLLVGYNNTKPEKLTDEDMKKIFIDVPNTTETENDVNNTIVVEVKGEVNKPNVYFLKEGSRIFELIDMAGGITSEGDLSSVNRASTLMDGQCIIVGNINDKNVIQGTSVNGISQSVVTGEERININIASKDELMKLSGVGESKAEAIIQYRTKSGGFKKIEDLSNVDGIGEKTVEKLKDKISIN